MREDLNTGPYRALTESLSEVFARTSRPVIYAAGHEHSLQVIDELDQAAAVLHLVSGSGSKVTGAKAIDGSRFTAGLPGYMRLDFRAGGRIQLGVIAECSEEAVVANICSVGGAASRVSIEPSSQRYSTSRRATGPRGAGNQGNECRVLSMGRWTTPLAPS